MTVVIGTLRSSYSNDPAARCYIGKIAATSLRVLAELAALYVAIFRGIKVAVRGKACGHVQQEPCGVVMSMLVGGRALSREDIANISQRGYCSTWQ
jgi:hypothetical protein